MAVVGGVLSGLEGVMASVTAAVCQPLSIIKPYSWLLVFFFFFFLSDRNYLTEHLCTEETMVIMPNETSEVQVFTGLIF